MKELHDAYNAGYLSMLKQTERSVLLWMCETCHRDSRIASISETELMRLVGLSRDRITKAIKALVDYRIIRRHGHGNQHRCCRYELLPLSQDAACIAGTASSDAACSADESSSDDAACIADTASSDPLAVFRASACSASTAHPLSTSRSTDLGNLAPLGSQGHRHGASLRSFHVDQLKMPTLTTWSSNVTH